MTPTTTDDPLSWPEEPDGTCCEHGYRTVEHGYAEREFPTPARPLGITDEAWAAVEAEKARLQTLAAGSVYPCKVHRPEQFDQWIKTAKRQRSRQPTDPSPAAPEQPHWSQT